MAENLGTRGRGQRQSNIELLRIVSMFLVLMVHYIPFRGGVTANSLRGGCLDVLFNLELRSLAFVCVNCFILISGYFGIKWKWRSLWNYLYQVMFWTILAYFVAIAIGIHDFNIKQFGWTLVTFVSNNWFKLSYLGLFMFAPVLESFVEKSTQRQLGCFIVAFYLFSTLFGWILQASPEFREGCTFVSLSGLYLIGAYTRRYDLNVLRFNKWIDLALYLGIGFLLVILSVIALNLGITSSLYGYLNPLVIIESVYLFLFFRKLDIGYSRLVNWIAASAFAAYLFHVNASLYGTYQDICRGIQDWFEYPFPVAVAFIIGVFAVAVVVDKLRLWSFNAMYRK